jgi:hypothetical protein
MMGLTDQHFGSGKYNDGTYQSTFGSVNNYGTYQSTFGSGK